MPNIELHGYGTEAAAMRARVREAIASSPELKEIITSVCETDPQKQDGDVVPYLRVIVEPKDRRNLNDLLRRLKPLNQDTEVLPLLRWISRQDTGIP